MHTRGLSFAALALVVSTGACKVGLTGVRRDANSNDASALQARLARGEDPNEPDAEGQTPLHWAVDSNATETLKVLVKSPKIALEARTKMGSTPLGSAAALGHLEAMKILLDAGADPNGAAPGHDTPLCEAAFWRKADAAALLLTRGGQPRRSCQDGKIALERAKETNYVDGSDPAPVLRVLEAAMKND